MSREKLQKKIIWVLCVVVLIGCLKLYQRSYFEIYYLKPKIGKSQCLTIFDGVKKRYIAIGCHTKIPKEDVLCLDVPYRKSLGDILYILWQPNKGWDMVIPHTKVKNNRLDTSLYQFKNELPKRDKYFPTDIKFRDSMGGAFDFSVMRGDTAAWKYNISKENNISCRYGGKVIMWW